MSSEPSVRVVLCTIPPDHAMVVARRLVEDGVAACVNLIPEVVSHFQWEGEVQLASESLLIIKTAGDRLDDLERRIGELHPYTVPEIVALDPAQVNGPYAAWLHAATRPTS